MCSVASVCVPAACTWMVIGGCSNRTTEVLTQSHRPGLRPAGRRGAARTKWCPPACLSHSRCSEQLNEPALAPLREPAGGPTGLWRRAPRPDPGRFPVTGARRSGSQSRGGGRCGLSAGRVEGSGGDGQLGPTQPIDRRHAPAAQPEHDLAASRFGEADVAKAMSLVRRWSEPVGALTLNVTLARITSLRLAGREGDSELAASDELTQRRADQPERYRGRPRSGANWRGSGPTPGLKGLCRLGGESGCLRFFEGDQAGGELEQREVVVVLFGPADQDRAVSVQPRVAGL